MIKHATASAFVFSRFPEGWRLGLITHPRLGRQMVPGGHVEGDESPEEAALRELVEESGLRVRLLEPPSLPLPSGYPHRRVAPPWWINEMAVPADNHVAVPHIHVDHQYVAIADDATPVAVAVHPFGWFAEQQLGELSMFEDTAMLAAALFTCIEDFAPGDTDAATMRRRFATVAG